MRHDDDWTRPAHAAREPDAEARPDSGRGHDWLDGEAGPVVRPYAVTGGRVRPVVHRLDLVVALPTGDAELLYLQPEHMAILATTSDPISVAEVAAAIDAPIGVVRVLLDDLLRQGLIAVRDQSLSTDHSDDDLLKAVIDGLRSL
jgi:hypothetical protein